MNSNSNIASSNSANTTKDHNQNYTSLILTDSLFDLWNVPKVENKNQNFFQMKNVSKKEKLCSIKKSIELKNNLKKTKKKSDFDFTKKEFDDNFGSEKDFAYFYKIKEKKKKFQMKFLKNQISNPGIIENIRKLNLYKFLFKNKHDIIYECDFCDLKFLKHTSLGGHISRSHSNKKKKIKKNKYSTIEKNRKNFLRYC